MYTSKYFDIIDAIRRSTSIYVLFSLSFLCTSPFAAQEPTPAQLLLRESNQSGISREQQLSKLKQAYGLAVAERDINSSGNALYEICVAYLEQGQNDNYLQHRKTFDKFYEQYKSQTTLLFLRLLDVESLLRSANHRQVVEQGEPLALQFNANDLTRKSRLNDGIYQFTLSDLARLNNFIGIAYFSLGEYEFAQQYFSDSLKFNIELGKQSVAASLLGNLSAVSWSQNNFERALEYTEQAIRILEMTDATQTLLRNILNKGVYLVELERNEEAQSLFDELIKHPEIENYSDIKVSALYNLASSLIEDKKFTNAEQYLTEAMTLSVKMNDEMSINDVNQQLAQLKIAQEDFNEAIPLLKENAHYYESKGLKRDMAETYRILSDAYRSLKHYKEALTFLDSYYSLMLELQSEARQQAITEFQEKYEAEQRENEIRELKSLNAINELKVESKNNLVKAIIAIGALLILLIWNQLRNKQKLASQFERMSLTDPLTKIGNRRYFKANIVRELTLTLRHGNNVNGNSLGIFIFDIDFFKKLNDKYGHDAGDAVLVEFANRIKAILRSSDILARWGGEEFVVAARVNATDDISLLASRILKAINGNLFQLSGQPPIKVTCSIGGITFPFIEDNNTIPDWHLLINLADHALYYAKENGRNQWVIVRNNRLSNFDDLKAHETDSLEELIASNSVSLVTSEDSTPK